jgi:hypothetical protein
MLRKTCALAVVAILTSAAAPASKAPPAKAPPARPAPAATAAAFNAQDPASLIALLATLDAKAEIAGRDGDAVQLKVTSPAGGFTVQFAGCNAQGKACSAAQFDAAAERTAPTLAQVNGFNQSSLTCRITQDRSGKPHILYSTLLFAGDTRQEGLTQIAAWRGCLADFGAFLKDPPGYLAVAP